jgi:hypothetical protein
MSDRKVNPTKPRSTARVKPREYTVNAAGTWEAIGIPSDAAYGALHNASDVNIWVSRSDGGQYVTLEPGAWSPTFKCNGNQTLYARSASGGTKRLEALWWGD